MNTFVPQDRAFVVVVVAVDDVVKRNVELQLHFYSLAFSNERSRVSWLLSLQTCAGLNTTMNVAGASSWSWKTVFVRVVIIRDHC